MRILYIDTTSNYLYSAIFEDSKITGEIKSKLDRDLSVFTLHKISEMFNSANIKPNDIDKILVVNGPGSFTGIRIGVTIAKTYAWGLGIPIATLSSLEAMAFSSKNDRDYKVSIIDARRGFCYAGIYDKDNHPVMKDKYLSLTALKVMIGNLPGDYNIISNDDIDINVDENYDPNFEIIIEKCKDRDNINPHSVNPIYLKLTEAEEKQGLDII